MNVRASSVPDQIMRRARAGGRGGVFTPRDFMDIGARTAVDQALSRLVTQGKLRRLVRGLYDFPTVHPKLGPLSPAPDVVAQALVRETGSRLQIDGPRAANALGLSEQVPATSCYLTDGPSRRVVLGQRVITVRHASPKQLVAPGSAAGTVVQALRHLGLARAADVARVATRCLSARDKKTLAAVTVHAPAWMRPTLVSIVGATSGDNDGRNLSMKMRRSSEKFTKECERSRSDLPRG